MIRSFLYDKMKSGAKATIGFLVQGVTKFVQRISRTYYLQVICLMRENFS